jgi:exodeoxyribonuclease VII large subunit
MAVPVRLDLLAGIDQQGARLSRAVAQGVTLRQQRLRDLARALPRLDGLTAPAAQRLDLWAGRLSGALGMAAARKRSAFEARAALIRPETLRAMLERRRDRLDDRAARLAAARARGAERAADRVVALGARLVPALARLITDAARDIAKGHERLAGLALRLDAAPEERLARLAQRLDALERTRATLGYYETLKRGYAVVRGDGAVVTAKADAEKASVLELEFQDGRLVLGARPAKGKRPGTPEQGSLF